MRSFFDLIASDDYDPKEKQQQLTKSIMGIAGVECELGRYDDAIDLYNQIIRDINEVEDDYDREFQLAFAYYAKSLPLSEKGNNVDALKHCQNALKFFLQLNDHTDTFVANCYEMIGNIYGNLARVERIKRNMNDSNQHIQTAFLHYNKALAVRRKLHKKTPDHHEICATYINIGELHRDIGQSDEALKYTLTAYNGFRKAFPNNHSWIGIALDNIGEIFVQQQKYTEAKEKYDEAIKIFKKTLPSDHRFIGETLHNIGKLYCCTYTFDKALHYFKQAKKIYNTKISKDHYLVTELNEQMNYAASQLHGVGG
jgi:tetratricopeptide (TPR) repeat protein